MARIVSEKPKATLSDALKAIEKNGLLHEALKDGFIKLYGYTSDADGIRHAMLDEPTLTRIAGKISPLLRERRSWLRRGAASHWPRTSSFSAEP